MPVVGSFPIGFILQGPWRHILQQRPSCPNLHCAPWLSARSMTVQTPESCNSENNFAQLLSQQSRLREPLTPSFAESLSGLTAVLDSSKTALPTDGERQFPRTHPRPQSGAGRARRTETTRGRNRWLEFIAMRIDTKRIDLDHDHSQSECAPQSEYLSTSGILQFLSAIDGCS